MESGIGFIDLGVVFAAIGLLALAAYWIFNFVLIYHLIRFGVGVQPKRFAAIFLLGSIFLFFLSSKLFTKVDISPFMQNISGFGNGDFNLNLNFSNNLSPLGK